jgi:hypothetical protein
MDGADYSYGCGCYWFSGNVVACNKHSLHAAVAGRAPVDWTEMRRQERRRLARQAGILADVVVNRKTLTQSQKDEVVALLRACEKELIDAS